MCIHLRNYLFIFFGKNTFNKMNFVKSNLTDKREWSSRGLKRVKVSQLPRHTKTNLLSRGLTCFAGIHVVSVFNANGELVGPTDPPCVKSCPFVCRHALSLQSFELTTAFMSSRPSTLSAFTARVIYCS